MTETVVHVTTLEQWKSVLDVWFKQGYAWSVGEKEYSAEIFENGGRFLFLDDYITYSRTNPSSKPFIEYSEFISKQNEDNKMATYYVTQEQLDFLNAIYEQTYSLDELLNNSTEAKKLFDDYNIPAGNAVLRYLGGDTSVEFKVKEPLYRLWAIDRDGEKTYFDNYSLHAPATDDKYLAFTAPLEEIEKWQTPAWDIEIAD